MGNEERDDLGKKAPLTRGHLRAVDGRKEGRRVSVSRAISPYQIPDAPPDPRELVNDRDEPPPPDEAWSHEAILESESYSRMAFYTQSSHTDEQTVVVKFAVSKSVIRRVEEIIEQRRFPELAVKADIFRDGLHHRLHDYALMMNQPRDDEMVSRIERTLSLVSLTSSLDDQQALYDQSKKLYETVCQRVEALRHAGNARGLERVLRDAASELDNMEEPWAGKLRKFVEENQRQD